MQANATAHQANRQAARLAGLLRGQGHSLPQIARELTAAGYRTRRGGAFHPTAVQRGLERAAGVSGHGSGGGQCRPRKGLMPRRESRIPPRKWRVPGLCRPKRGERPVNVRTNALVDAKRGRQAPVSRRIRVLLHGNGATLSSPAPGRAGPGSGWTRRARLRVASGYAKRTGSGEESRSSSRWAVAAAAGMPAQHRAATGGHLHAGRAH